jgi:hypothetical protein
VSRRQRLVFGAGDYQGRRGDLVEGLHHTCALG